VRRDPGPAEGFGDLGRVCTATLTDERLRRRYVALQDALVATVAERPGIAEQSLADLVGADLLVTIDELRIALAHGRIVRFDGRYFKK
jgi:hypothetical protein